MLIVGLGNPGPDYAAHRHNVGFMVLDRLNEVLSGDWTDKKRYSMSRVRLSGGAVSLLKPMTYMNRSGNIVAERTRFLNISSEEVLVVHDDLDLPLGRIRLKNGGGAAGHNGLRSIAADLGTSDFPRIRVGIGRPARKEQVRSYVLNPFHASEQEDLQFVLDGGVEACEGFVSEGLRATQNLIHGKVFLASLPS